MRPITPKELPDSRADVHNGPARVPQLFIDRDGSAAPLAFSPRESDTKLHRSRQAPRRARPPPRTGHEPAVVVGRADPRPVPLGRPRNVGDHGPRPRPPPRTGEPRAARTTGRRPGLHGLSAGGSRRPEGLPRIAAVVPRPLPQPAPGHRLLLTRVRPGRGAAPVLGRPRRA